MKNFMDELSDFKKRTQSMDAAVVRDLIQAAMDEGENFENALRYLENMWQQVEKGTHLAVLLGDAQKALQGKRDEELDAVLKRPFKHKNPDEAKNKKLAQQNDRLQEQLQKTITENLQLKRGLLAAILEAGPPELVVRNGLAEPIFGLTDDQANQLQFSYEVKYDGSIRIFYNYHEFREEFANFRPTLNPNDLVPPRGKEHLYKKGGHKL